MPVVPIDQNRVGIANTTDAKLRAPDMSGTGPEAFGQGLQQLGKAGEEFANARFEYGQRLEVAGAKTLDTSLMRTVLDQGEAFRGLQGVNAANALHPYLEGLDKLGNDVLSQATSPHMRNLMAPVVAERIASARSAAMEHARTQSATALEDATTARVDMSRSSYLAARTEADRETNYATGMADIQHYWDGKTGDPTVGKQKALAWGSSLLAAHAGNLMDTNHVDDAAAFIEANRSRFTGDDLDKVTAALAPIVRDRTLEAKADQYTGVAGPDGSASNFVSPVPGVATAPVPGGQYGAPRTYGGKPGSHQGVDIPAPIGTPVHSGHGPGIARVTHSALGGNIVTITHDDGTRTKYDHLGKVNVTDGARVDATTVIGAVGMTGRSTGPHLHYEVIDKNGQHVDPGHLATAIRQGPTRQNLDAALAAVDRDTSLTPEDRTALKAKISGRVGMSDQIRERGFQDAADAAARWRLQQKPGSFTDYSQLPASIRSALKPEMALTLQNEAEANRRALAVGPTANGPAAVLLHRQMYENPTAFAQMDLSQYHGMVSSSEYDELSSEQAKLRAKPNEGAKYSDVFTTINNFGRSVLGAPPKAPDKPDADPANPSSATTAYRVWEQNRLALADHMRRYVERLQRFDPNFKPSDDTYRKAYEDATLRTLQPDGKTYQYRYLQSSPRSVSMSQADEARIRRQLGPNATPDQIMRVYLTAAVHP